ncbi:MAG TPA: DUF3761 domain-containing protein [Albitalea sp.]|nr:DUF3761 domain-containing protein [Albitalea sp.]
MLGSALVLAWSAHAAPPPEAPAGSTGMCKDGTYYSGAEKKGACRGHKGVKEWYADAATNADAKAPAKPVAAAPAASVTTSKKAAPMAMPAAQAPGGGPNMVWANETSKVYHCPGDKWYGKTKHGEYLSEADAKAKGFKPDHGKACKA